MADIRTILSGDLALSTELSETELDEAFAGLEDATAEIEAWHGQSVHFTRNRGDAWQICLPGPTPGLREALALRAGLKLRDRRYDTRIAIATDVADVPADGNLNEAGGPGFIRAGRLLDTLSGTAFDHASGGALSAALILAGEISHGWTSVQARAILPMLAPDPPIHAEVAKRHGVTRQAIRQALIGGGYNALAEALARVETAP